MDRSGARRCVPGGERDVVVLGFAARHQLDLRADRISIALRPLQSEVEPVIGALTDIDPDLSGSGEGADHHVETAVAVEIADRRTAVARRTLRAEPRIARKLRKSRAAGVAKDRIWLFNLRRILQRLYVAARDKHIFPAVV